MDIINAAGVIADVASLLTEQIKNRTTEANQLNHDLAYWPAFVEVDPTVAIPTAVLRYTNSRIRLRGRDNEVMELEKFLSQDTTAPSIWAVVGDGGTGKSKFVFETVRAFTEEHQAEKHQADKWKKIWWEPGTAISERWTEDNYPYNLILVVDYVGSCANELAKKLNQLTPNRKHKLRVILIERENITQVPSPGGGSTIHNPSWLDTLLGAWNKQGFSEPELTQFFYKGDKKNNLSPTTFLTLPPLKEEALLQILEDYYGRRLSDSNAEKIFKLAQRFSRDGNSITPLSLLMAADLIPDPEKYQEDQAASLERGELFQKLLEKEEKHWKMLCPNLAEPLCPLYCYATLVGGWQVSESVPEELITTEKLIQFRDTLHHDPNLLDNLGGSSDEGLLPRMAPDLVGEFFALQELDKQRKFYGKPKLQSLIQTIWGKEDTENKNTRNGFIDFLLRAAQDYPDWEIVDTIIDLVPKDSDKAWLLHHLIEIGVTNGLIGNYEKAKVCFEKAIENYENYEAISVELTLNKADCYHHLGLCCAKLDDPEGAKGHFEKAIEIQEAISDEPTQDKMYCYLHLGLLYSLELGNHKEANGCFEKAKAFFETILAPTLEEAICYAYLGAYCGDELGDYDGAIDKLNHSIGLCNDLLKSSRSLKEEIRTKTENLRQVCEAAIAECEERRASPQTPKENQPPRCDGGSEDGEGEPQGRRG